MSVAALVALAVLVVVLGLPVVMEQERTTLSARSPCPRSGALVPSIEFAGSENGKCRAPFR
jgi:hypothetical protein